MSMTSIQVTASRVGWQVVHIVDDRVTERTTTHRQWPGELSVSRHDDWGRRTYFLSRCSADSLRGSGNGNYFWRDGRLVFSPSLFRNGKPRPINKRYHPQTEEVAEAEHLIRSMGWEG